MDRVKSNSKKVLVGIVGGFVTLVGIVLIPYPGPGWLIVFAGLAILSTEFAFASRLLHFARGKYDAWVDWLKRQSVFVRILTLAFTGCAVLLTLWLINVFGLFVSVLNIPLPFLVSPFAR